MTNEIIANKNKNMNTVAIIIDLEKAFDLVDNKILLLKLQNIGIENCFIEWIQNFLTNREYVIKNSESACTASKITSDGLPQGSILSPLLFNIYTASLHMTGIQNTEIIQYADDFTILVSGKNHKEIQNNCDEIMSKFYNELNKLKLKLNTQKCRTILFNWKRKKLMEKISVKINGQNIERTNTQRILGFYIDNKLNFNKHIREMQDSCKKRIIIVKAFSGPNRGSHIRNKCFES